MNNKTKIYHKLVELSDHKNGINTKTLASILGMSRSNVSHELNKLYKEGKVTKSSGRPVLFFVADKIKSEKESKIDQFVKHNPSLKQTVEQAKAAILYPPRGLPTLILGQTGVGKSMFASLIYQYAVDMKVLEKSSPFISFNCADYSNNPQLLVSQLFGVKKGAYTGAESNKQGLIEKADGGILFLDEVHRLPPEGQESLFTFLDSKTFRRIGDNTLRTSNAFIIAATTEDPNSSLLQTFIRRIPMMITIPPLKERSFDEKLYLIKYFFKQESIKLNKEIYVSYNAIKAFLSYDCPNNIGQLKSDIQIACAKAYSKFLTNLGEDIKIEIKTLSPYIREGLLKEGDHKLLWNKLEGGEIEFFKFSPKREQKNFDSTFKSDNIYDFIEQKLTQLKYKGFSEIDIESILQKDILKHFQKYINRASNTINKKDLLNLLEEDVINCVDKVVDFVCQNLNFSFSKILYTSLALHIGTIIKRIQKNKTIMNPQLEKIKETYPKEFQVALKAKEIIADFFHCSIPDDEAGYLTLFFLQEEMINQNSDKVKVILIFHGKSTASSMAEIANKLLGEKYALAIDAPINITPSETLDKLRNLIRNNPSHAGYLLLVDMGSFITFSEIIENEFQIPVKSIPLVSTLHVIEAVEKSISGLSLEEVYKNVLSINSYREHTRNSKKVESKNKKIAIIICSTDQGGAATVNNILFHSLKFDQALFEIISLNYSNKDSFYHKLKRIQKEREILCIISPFPLDTKIKQYNMYDVISMNTIEEFQKIIDKRTALIKMPLILKENFS